MVEEINLYPAPTPIDIGNRLDNDPPIFEKINLYKVKKAYITTYGFILKNITILKEGISFRHRNSISFKNILSFLFRKKKIKINTPAISITNGWYESYYHFTVECLPKLYLLRDYIDCSVLIFPSKINDFHSKWFKILGVKNIRYINENEIIYTPLAITTSFTSRDLNHHNVVLPEFRNWVLRHIKNINAINFKKIFIGRKNPTHRKVLNIEQIKLTLKELGFIYIEMEDYSVEDQIKLFHNAEQIICVHGAALSNMCFSNPKTKVIDLIHEEFKQWCFLKMAIILEINYYPFPCKGNNSNLLPGYQDIIVDISKLKENIKQWNQ